jgi:hypothetical protein
MAEGGSYTHTVVMHTAHGQDAATKSDVFIQLWG